MAPPFLPGPDCRNPPRSRLLLHQPRRSCPGESPPLHLHRGGQREPVFVGALARVPAAEAIPGALACSLSLFPFGDLCLHLCLCIYLSLGLISRSGRAGCLSPSPGRASRSASLIPSLVVSRPGGIQAAAPPDRQGRARPGGASPSDLGAATGVRGFVGGWVGTPGRIPAVLPHRLQRMWLSRLGPLGEGVSRGIGFVFFPVPLGNVRSLLQPY